MATVQFDIETLYEAWRAYLLANSKAKYFGMVYDATRQAKFPYANFKMIGRPTVGGDLQGDEATVNLTVEAEAYINNNKYTVLYNIDTASANFLNELGFRRVGDSQIIKVSDTVTMIQSRFSIYNFYGSFLKDITAEENGDG